MNVTPRDRAAFEAAFYDIWRCFYDGTCPSGSQRDEDLTDLRRRYPGQPDPVPGITSRQ